MINVPDKKIEYKNDSKITLSFYADPHIFPHKHKSSIEIVYCLSGTATVRCANDVIDLAAGDFYIVNFGEAHCIYSDEASILVSVYIDYKNLDKYAGVIATSYFSAGSQTTAQIYEIKDILLSIILEFALNPDADLDFIDSICEQLMDALLDNFDWFSNEKIPSSSKEIYRERFLRTLDYCYENYRNRITLKDLAEREHVNENYFSQVMKKSSYNSFSNMLNAVRCWIAEEYLLESDYSIMEISEMCGFSDQKYFYSNFEKMWGMKPGQLRKWYNDYCQTPESRKKADTDALIRALQQHTAQYHLKNIRI